jgi:hypothetical protein
MGAYTYYWGAMGGSMEEFLCSINKEYFVDKLCQKTGVFCAKESTQNVRRHIRKNLPDLPFWKFMEAQKEMRKYIKDLESCQSEQEFISICGDIPNAIMCFDLSYKEEKEFKDIIRDVFTCEPWYFIGEKPSRESEWLSELHGKIVNQLQPKVAA